MYHDTTNPYQPQKLRLAEFRAIYKQTKHLPSILRYLILGLLYWLEERYISYKIDTTLTNAIKDYHEQAAKDDAPHWQQDAIVTVTENPSSSHQLPTLTISAPYQHKGFDDE
jgi:hypothetical protein